MPRTALVTGAASGIGLACTKLLLKEGCQVMAFDPQENLMRQNIPEEKGVSFFCGGGRGGIWGEDLGGCGVREGTSGSILSRDCLKTKWQDEL